MKSLLTSLLVLLALGCADIRFERSPYAIRGVDVVYSEQEDLTFFVWRLRDSADPSLVTFELYQDGEYVPLDLKDTAFPAEPYPCDNQYLCFQYQLPGIYTFPQDILPLRSIHAEEGLYAGSVPRLYQAPETFTASPFAYDQNRQLDPRFADWFELNEIPLERTFEWQVVTSSRPDYRGGAPETCATPTEAAWSGLADALEVDYAWVESPACFALRPRRADAPGALLQIPFIPGAELYAEQQDYVPPEERPPIIYAFLTDLSIRGERRCAEAKGQIIQAFDGIFGRRAQDAIRLGTFTPTDPETGQPTDGCSQKSGQDYPVRQIVQALKEQAARLAPQNVRFVIVYMNNVELPPSERILMQLLELGIEIMAVPNALPYTVAVGSNVALSLFEWDRPIGWRPISDQTLFGDIRDWGDATIAFRTTLHDESTEIQINPPVGATNPEAFKICQLTPTLPGGVGYEPGGRLFSLIRTHPWPGQGRPHYTIALPPQILVPFNQYKRDTFSLVVEACTRFCDFPFRTSSGTDLSNWSNVPEVCQWSQQ